MTRPSRRCIWMPLRVSTAPAVGTGELALTTPTPSKTMCTAQSPRKHARTMAISQH